MIVNQKREPVLANWGVSLAHYMRNRASAAVSRYLTYFDSVFQQHLRLKEQRLSGPLKITLKGTFDDKGFYITGTKDTAQSRILVTTSGALYVGTWAGNKSQNLSDLSWRNDGLVHTIVIERAQNNYWSFKVDDGENLVSGMLRSGTVQFNSIFAQYGGSTAVPYYSGMPFLMEIEDAGVPYIRYNFDKDMSKTRVVENELAVLGSELWPDGDITNISVPETFKPIASGDVNLLNNGDQYWIKYTNNTNVPVSVVIGDGAPNYLSAQAGESVEGLIEYVDTSQRYRFQTTGQPDCIGSIDDISIKQADNYATAVDVTDSVKFTEVESKRWESEELAGSSEFNFTATYAYQQFTQPDSANLVIGSIYRARAENTLTTQFRLRPMLGAYVNPVYEREAPADYALMTWHAREIGDYKLRNISIKQILKEAI